MGKRSYATSALLVASAAVWWLRPTEAQPEEDYALFTHGRGELHCPDRELRHLCVPELRDFVRGEAKEPAYECCARVLEESANDFYMLKNMTHLLLDLDGNLHVFDRHTRDNEFIDLGIQFGRALLAHPTCLGDFDALDEFECRCFPLYTKILVLKLKNAGRWEEAQALFDTATGLAWSGEVNVFRAGEAVRWTSLYQTPQIVVPGLRALPVWPREAWDGPNGLPIAHRLEQHFETIRRETELVLEHAPEEWSPTYRFLFDKGDWSQVLLYHGKEFRPECEQLFPETCALLRQWLPSKPGVPWVSDQNEQVLVLRMQPGTTVELHSGPANSILNVHLGIKGLKGAKLGIAQELYEWEEGKVIAWDGSFDHTVNCVDCEEPRVIMMVRYMHPDVTEETYTGHKKTHFESLA